MYRQITRASVLALAALLCLASAGPHAAQDDKGNDTTVPLSNWWTFQADLARTGRYPGREPEPPLSPKWSRGFGPALPAASVRARTQVSHPVFGSNAVIVGTGEGDGGSLHALSLADGSVRWSFTDSRGGRGRFHGAPAAASGAVYAATTAGMVYAVNEADGRLLWETRLSAGSLDAVAVSSRKVFVRTTDQKLHALRQSDGAVIWSVAANARGTTERESAPALALRNVVVAFDDGLYAFNRDTGQLAWRYALPSPAKFSYPVVQMEVSVGGTPFVVVTAEDGSAHAVKATNGQLLWRSGTSGAGLSPSDGFAVSERELLRLRGSAVTIFRNDGQVDRTFPAVDSSAARRYPAVIGNTLYYGSSGRLRSVNTRSGEVWEAGLSNAPNVRLDGPGQAGASPRGDGGGPYGIAIDKELVVVTSGGQVFAFKSYK